MKTGDPLKDQPAPTTYVPGTEAEAHDEPTAPRQQDAPAVEVNTGGGDADVSVEQPPSDAPAPTEDAPDDGDSAD